MTLQNSMLNLSYLSKQQRNKDEKQFATNGADVIEPELRKAWKLLAKCMYPHNIGLGHSSINECSAVQIMNANTVFKNDLCCAIQTSLRELRIGGIDSMP